MAPIGHYYHGGKLAPIGYHYDDGELLPDIEEPIFFDAPTLPNAWKLEWRQANVYERLQKLRDFVERSGGLVLDTKRPSKVWFALPYAILKELFEASAELFNKLYEANGELFEADAKIWVHLDHDGAISRSEDAYLPTGESLQMFLASKKIKIPESASNIASTGIGAMVDLVSIKDDELELITRHRTSAS
jgi:hypothetical protein